MQPSPSLPAPGTLVRVRRQHWRVVRTLPGGEAVLVTLAGAARPNAGVIRSFLAPFDRIERLEQSSRVRRVSRRRWRNAVRALIASTAPAGSLRVLVRARVDVLPHQLEPALAVVRGLATRVLLADDVGLGKTIEAGLILAELLERGAASRALVLTPAGLRDQWQAELRDRFGIEAAIADAASLATASAAYAAQPNPWLSSDVVIASIDLAKRSEHLAAILHCAWDLVVVDEAHNAVGATDRHDAVDAIGKRTPYVVLATATPHNGDRSAFASLCEIGNHAEACAIFRRTRRVVRPASARHARLLGVALTPAERRMHDALAELTRAVVAEDGAERDARLGIAVLNKRALSSAEALRRSALRRLEALADGESEALQAVLPFDDVDGELDGSDEAPAWIGPPALADAARERRLLGKIVNAAEDAVRQGESKLRLLSRWLRRVTEPAIVFTEYRDTLGHAAEAIGGIVLQLHGGLSAVERRSVLRAFPSSARILLATDAAGEGLNLQERCRVVINLELPWNPVRIEQRIGRVDRIGQARTVHAMTLIAAATPEERILERLRVRIARARQDLGAGEPFGIFTESDVRDLALGIERFDAPPPMAVEPAAFDLGEAAREEARRVHLVRSLVREPGGVDGAQGRPVAGALRHRSAHPAGSIVLIEAIVEDGSGAVVERCLIPVSIGSREVDPAIVEALERCDVITAAAGPARSVAERFAKARLERERAIAGTKGDRVSPLQGGLFDRRAERAAAAASAATSSALAALGRRRACAEAAASATSVRVRVRVILQARR